MPNLLKQVMTACEFLSCIPLAILVVITTMDVIARYALATSVPDTIEISGLMLGLLISLALAPTTFGDRQVRVEGFRVFMPETVRAVTEAIIRLIGAAIFGLMAWQAVARSSYSFRVGEYVGSMEIQVWPVKVVFAFGAFLTCVGLGALVVSAVRRLSDTTA